MHTIKRILLTCLLLFVAHAEATTQPKFSLTPLTPTRFPIALDETVTVQYQVTNNTALTRTLTMTPITGATQITTSSGYCADPFTLATNQSCTLTLSITGSEVVREIPDGPKVCATQNNNQPNPFLCSQPSKLDSLNIKVVRAKRPTLFDSPELLTLEPLGQSGTITITNSSTVITARNIKADLTGTILAGNITQDATNCVSVAPGATCNLIFTPGQLALSNTSFPIKGVNTRTVAGNIEVVSPTTALISVEGSPLILAENTSGQLTIRNHSGTLSATGIRATGVPAGITQNATNCTNSPVPPGGTCTLTFTAGATAVNHTTIDIYGTDTSLTTATVGVNGPDSAITFTSPSSISLVANGTSTGTMTMQNTSGATIVGGLIADIAGTDLNGLVSVTGCTADIPVGGTCTFTFNAETYTLPATTFPIYGAGSNITNTLVGTITLTTAPEVYLTSANSNTLYHCLIDSAGDFSNCYTMANFSGINAPRGIVINAAKTRAYVVNNGNTTISKCDINQKTRYLENCVSANQTATTLSNSIGITLNPAGTYAYITNTGNNTISKCAINATTGLFDGNCADAGAVLLSNPRDIKIKSTGDFAYIANFGNAQIIQCAINGSTGALNSCYIAHTGIGGEQYNGLALNATKKTLYSADFNYSYILSCPLLDGGGLSGVCISLPYYNVVYRSAGVAVNALGTTEYIANTFAEWYGKLTLDTNGVVLSYSHVYPSFRGYIWGIALLD